MRQRISPALFAAHPMSPCGAARTSGSPLDTSVHGGEAVMPTSRSKWREWPRAALGDVRPLRRNMPLNAHAGNFMIIKWYVPRFPHLCCRGDRWDGGSSSFLLGAGGAAWPFAGRA